ncbi:MULTISPECIES: DNA ligase D [unclassified Sphingomonas]|uniref:DNA ligase D n=1 Tax=unclassified Sphingomonas TaxID=196159 RepID=UPI0006FCEF46|nr:MULTISPECIES: DNA ligase D [unclassified Sphingomonas]KQM62161.1 ATP-dependent DNA ligase [Sphingomonas sp. Leaf16]KQN13564.1 ATP-dependent DNA ligase [Sphingomonas sp. Leaf29]KQN23202.1 ATP-dependent DNA ligase [Sphingomonas sp. Leaf32]
MARKSDRLATYNAKRDFARTAEPAGTLAKGQGNRFVVQKHDATRLHYDFRLEVDGVLKSWAVTRGPSLDPDQKRLAVRTEDHPLDYAGFEGVIPAGEYGGGTVMLWDEGTWSPVAGKSAKDLDKGHLHFVLAGQRMRGEWLLVRLKPRAREKRENWLLRKVADAQAGGTDTLTATMLTSVTTGRTMEEIAAGKRPRRKPVTKAKRPAFVAPQLATLVDAVPTGSDWLHEVKYDGYRILIATGGGGPRLYTRTGLDWTGKFPGIAEAAQNLPGGLLIDGEVVALKNGKPDFSTLQAAIKEGGEMRCFAFDLLHDADGDRREEPLVRRKDRLRAVLADADPRIAYSEHVTGSGERLFAAMCTEGYEGIVSKRADAPYRGTRSRGWLKVKCIHRQEFVILGWLPSAAKGRPFRSLLLGVQGKDGLRYVGKVGTGFDAAGMSEIEAALAPLARKTPPVELPAALRRGAKWVTPKLVAEVAFAEFTGDGMVRHASFVGLRGDKAASDVVREMPVAADATPAVRITSADRVIFPGDRLTKGDLAAYVERVASLLLRTAADRPLSLVRCPQGRGKACFFQKHDAGSFGDAVHAIDIAAKDGKREPYLYVRDAAGLLSCVQMGTIEFHGWGSGIVDVEKPDRMVFDLDPDEGLDFADVKRAAHDLSRHLADLGLASFAMLSGGKGVHVVVPLTPDAGWPVVKDFADRFARALAQAEPDRFTATMAKAKRKGRIFIDWLRNQRGSTAVLPYSARARPGAPVAAPVAWRELDAIDTPARWTIRDADDLLERADSRLLAGWGIADQVLPDR